LTTKDARPQRVRSISVRRLLIGFVALLAVIAASVTGYIASRHSTNQQSYFGDFDNPDRVEVTAWITRIDATAQTMSMTIIDVRPFGSLADTAGNFAQDATLFTDAVGTWRAQINAGDSAPDLDQRITVSGAATDYPFDRYVSTLELHVADADGNELPTAITVLNTDSFFRVSMAQASAPSGGTMINLDIHRSMPTLVFAVFIMVLMLGLAGAAAVAAHYVLYWKRGLVWGACSMLAGILFALIPLRNAVPGDPPVGSIIDFGSFFIAEAIISLSLISGIIVGFRHQMAIEHAEAQLASPSADHEPIDEADPDD
jgi:hypothetical protein